MIIIPVKEGEAIDRALKRFKRKFDKVGTLREIRGRKNFVKKSTRRREELLKAKYSLSFLNSQDK
ncbi:MAG: 30S ribosomal protein S21 [Flavobacteriales bacterium]|nr:30S ribosomal protein S21 [Flavobacteriales bacterium]|tara:strand:+ start:1883 stop:2077 length:195 start_codon:yes stop_codon:yes gene_type:complete